MIAPTLHSVFAALLMVVHLLAGAGWAPGMVLCIGGHGHIAVERPHDVAAHAPASRAAGASHCGHGCHDEGGHGDAPGEPDPHPECPPCDGHDSCVDVLLAGHPARGGDQRAGGASLDHPVAAPAVICRVLTPALASGSAAPPGGAPTAPPALGAPGTVVLRL